MSTEITRQLMVTQQIRTWDVFDDRVLNVFGRVPREEFVPPASANVAYADGEIPLPHSQCMLRPSIVGKMLQALEVAHDDDVLEIGTGTGYVTACLSQLGRSVSSVDIFDDFISGARQKLENANIDNVTLQCRDAMHELPEGEFDVVVVSGSTIELEQRFVAVLKPGGRLFCVVGESPAKTALLVRRGFEDSFITTELFETDIPALLSVRIPSSFLF